MSHHPNIIEYVQLNKFCDILNKTMQDKYLFAKPDFFANTPLKPGFRHKYTSQMQLQTDFKPSV